MTDSEIVAYYRSRLVAACATRDAQDIADVAYEMLADLSQIGKELAQALADAEGFESRAIDAETAMEERYTISEVDEKTSEMQAEHESEMDALILAHESELDALTNPRRPLPAGWRPGTSGKTYPEYCRTSPSMRWAHDR